MREQDVERMLLEHQQDIISDTVVNQKRGRPYYLQLAPIATQNIINLDEIHFKKKNPFSTSSQVNNTLQEVGIS